MSISLDNFTVNGKFLMLALDHRGSIRKIINPENPEKVTNQEIVNLKSGIIDSLKDQFSGLLIDQEYGLPAYQERKKPFLLPLEKTGYEDRAGERITDLSYTAQDLKNMGAQGAKLLIYFNPNVASAKTQIETAKKALYDCRTNNLPLFLEIVTYGGEGMVLDSVKMFIQNGVLPDVFKLEYPGSEQTARFVTQATGGVPWIILTGGEKFELFKEQLKISVASGAKGFLAGRALWQELPSLSGEKRLAFLTKTLPERFKEISEIAKG